MSSFVLDASAVLAFLNQENGADLVERLIPDSKISAVNVAEVLARSIELGHTNESAQESFTMLGLEIIDFDERHAVKTAELRALTRHLGLSLGDRSCLASSILASSTAVTADRAWKKIKFCNVDVIR